MDSLSILIVRLAIPLRSEKYIAKLVRSSLFNQTVVAQLPDGGTCSIAGNGLRITGDFEVSGQSFRFDGGKISSGNIPIATYNYSSGVMGVGHSLSLSGVNGEHLFSLCPQSGIWASGFIMSNPGQIFGEINRSFLGTQYLAIANGKLAPELVLLCVWVAVTKMSA